MSNHGGEEPDTTGGDGPQIDIAELTDQLANRLVSSTSIKIRQFGGSRTEKENTSRWLEDFGDMAESMGWDEEAKCRKLPAFLAGTAKDWYRLDVAPHQTIREDWTRVKAALEAKFLPMALPQHQRHQLESRKQGLYEDVSDYILAKRRLCAAVNDAMEEDEILRRVKEGLQPDLREKVEMFGAQITSVTLLDEYAQRMEHAMKSKQDQPAAGKQPVGTAMYSTDDCGAAMYNAPGTSSQESALKGAAEKVFREMLGQYKQLQERTGRNNYGENNYGSRNSGNNNYGNNNNYKRGGNNSRGRTNDGKPICHYCQKPGHMRRDCRRRLGDERRGIRVNSVNELPSRGQPQQQQGQQQSSANLAYESDDSVFTVVFNSSDTLKNPSP